MKLSIEARLLSLLTTFSLTLILAGAATLRGVAAQNTPRDQGKQVQGADDAATATATATPAQPVRQPSTGAIRQPAPAATTAPAPQPDRSLRPVEQSPEQQQPAAPALLANQVTANETELDTTVETTCPAPGDPRNAVTGVVFSSGDAIPDTGRPVRFGSDTLTGLTVSVTFTIGACPTEVGFASYFPPGPRYDPSQPQALFNGGSELFQPGTTNTLSVQVATCTNYQLDFFIGGVLPAVDGATGATYGSNLIAFSNGVQQGVSCTGQIIVHKLYEGAPDGAAGLEACFTLLREDGITEVAGPLCVTGPGSVTFTDLDFGNYVVVEALSQTGCEPDGQSRQVPLLDPDTTFTAQTLDPIVTTITSEVTFTNTCEQATATPTATATATPTNTPTPTPPVGGETETPVTETPTEVATATNTPTPTPPVGRETETPVTETQPQRRRCRSVKRRKHPSQTHQHPPPRRPEPPRRPTRPESLPRQPRSPRSSPARRKPPFRLAPCQTPGRASSAATCQ